ncbi:hypothetical protein [Nocardia sp. NPDC050710]|uniref:hypothetical protein n=1 Tax=Nocardia sp. NPDC050710 TaxID=3157220 RepID=UPI0033EE0188
MLAVSGCGDDVDRLPDLEQSLTFTGAVTGHLTHGVNAREGTDSGSGQLTMTQCATSEVADLVLGDNGSDRVSHNYEATIVGDIRPGYRVALRLWTNQDNPAYRDPGQVHPLPTGMAVHLYLPDAPTIVDGVAVSTPTMVGGVSTDVPSTIMFDADRKGGTIDVWLNTYDRPREEWVNIAGRWRCG